MTPAPIKQQIDFADFEKIDIPLVNGNFYLCGPLPFMKFAKADLIKLGVCEARIHYEVFGPHNTL